VMIDNHAREDQTFLTDTDGWVRGWSRLAGALNRDPSIRGRVIFDILNEPDQFGVRWEGSNRKPALKDLYLRAMDAIEAVAPNAIFAIEGTGQGNLGANWGGKYRLNRYKRSTVCSAVTVTLLAVAHRNLVLSLQWSGKV
jgi:hypothetical protein